MDIDTDKIDEATLALPYLGLYEKGLISDPVGKAKSLVLTDEGLRESERLFRELFAGRGCRAGRRPFLPPVDQ